MSEDVGSLAWSIIRTIQNETLLHTTPDAIESSEAVRLCSLGFSLSSYVDNSIDFQFKELSQGAERSGVKKTRVLDLVKHLQDAKDLAGLQSRVRTLSLPFFGELLAQLHSIGSHHPRGRTGLTTSKRDIGAFYTPLHVSDYITELTLGPTLDTIFEESKGEATDVIQRLRIIDPSCGPGAFLLSAARTIMNRLEKNNLQHLSSKISDIMFGVDIDNAALEVASVSLSLMCGDSVRSNFGNLHHGNSLVSFQGWDGDSDYRDFFEEPSRMLALEWKNEFPDIFDSPQGGFDFALMNPPYDRLKPNLAEFLRERLLTGSREIHEHEFQKHKRELRESVDYFKNSGEYSLGNTHTINTYQLFIERALKLLKLGGRLGFIVPSTLLGDTSATKLREHLLFQNRILHLSEYPEGARVFPGVTQSVCISILEKSRRQKSFNAAFAQDDVGDIPSSQFITLKPVDIRTMNGSSLAIPRVAKKGWTIIKRIHAFPSLGSISWLENRRGELDLSLDRKYIQTTPGETRLIRGANVARYRIRDHSRLGIEYVNCDEFMSSKSSSLRLEHVSLPRIACQQISNKAQRWRLKFSLVKKGDILANSCNYITVQSSVNEDVLLYLLGLLNSDLLNWRFDSSNFNNHVSNREISSLPIVDPFFEMNCFSNAAKVLIEEVRTHLKNPVDFSPPIEAHVFNLYGCSSSDTRYLLKLRGATQEEIKSVLIRM